MKYNLLKHKNMKLLISDECSREILLTYLPEIEALAKKVSHFYANLMHATNDDAASIEAEKKLLLSKIGYNIIGLPFSNHDAELYALDKKLNYKILQLIEYERINVDVEKPLKTLAVRHINNSEHKNLAKYIEYLIKKDLGLL